MCYAGHATPPMTMHYVAARQEHAERAFLVTTKLRADGTHVKASPETTTTASTCSTGSTDSCPTAGAYCRPCRPAAREMAA